MESVDNRTVIDARLKPIYRGHFGPRNTPADALVYKVLCGLGRSYGTVTPCSGVLGVAYPFGKTCGHLDWQISSVFSDQESFEAGDELDGRWYVYREEGFSRGDDGVYRVMRDYAVGRKQPRRKVKQSLYVYIGGAEEVPHPLKGAPRDQVIMGDPAIVPVTIECPQCFFQNLVATPS